MLIATPTALASLNDDRFDGNIFALYAGNGSLVPAKVTLQDSLKSSKPALLIFFLDDSKDCKQFSTVVSELQRFYGRAANFIPVNVDTIINPVTNDSTKTSYYYQGFVPQTVLINQKGKVVLNEKGQVSFERVDDVFREVFDLLPRSESVELKRRIVNEINVELTDN
ncbi:thylakoid membrane photosystem I accumulation factor [Okeania sp.]|uniref:thylakoid membrane photosystem I accumulation factor n=1 Tax=Okeania sp. TaxID=3100323 RepID=UPI002B4B891B|nr:thylakoid membrane photosystem I accumulation factor [Okeania sp.]MEB3341227.1 thylakoid membrane photosystem I accumulation factor [Okeania sp.]